MDYEKLKEHIGHRVLIVCYGEREDPHNIALECDTCGAVLDDYDHPSIVPEAE